MVKEAAENLNGTLSYNEIKEYIIPINKPQYLSLPETQSAKYLKKDKLTMFENMHSQTLSIKNPQNHSNHTYYKNPPPLKPNLFHRP